jgi:hypothetical protein
MYASLLQFNNQQNSASKQKLKISLMVAKKTLKTKTRFKTMAIIYKVT